MTATALDHDHPPVLDALHLSEDVPPATLAEARADLQALARLLNRERAAAADFLLALADFDRRRGWERLGHASLFAFLTRDLGLSKGGAFFRLTAARLLQRFPEILEPLRDGRLCITAVVELAKVVPPENCGEVLPRFFGCSSREAKEVAAALSPRAAPPVRTVVTLVKAPGADLQPAPGVAWQERPALDLVQSTEPHPLRLAGSPAEVHAPGLERPLGPPAPASERPVAEPSPGAPSGPVPREEVEPLTADLRRLHLTVSKGFLQKLSAARDGLVHHGPVATAEATLEAALDLLLERQARRHALVKRPRTPGGRRAGGSTAPTLTTSTEPASSPPDRRRIPAHVEREVRLRDGGRCQFPIDSGGVCGSTFRVELDHVVPVALGGEATVANLRCTCAVHNARAAEALLGPGLVRAARRQGRRGGVR